MAGNPFRRLFMLKVGSFSVECETECSCLRDRRGDGERGEVIMRLVIVPTRRGATSYFSLPRLQHSGEWLWTSVNPSELSEFLVFFVRDQTTPSSRCISPEEKSLKAYDCIGYYTSLSAKWLQAEEKRGPAVRRVLLL